MAPCFLALSAETRNRIYCHALVVPNRIPIDEDSTPPALTQVNRQIRHESLGIYYLQNHFDFSVTDHDHHILFMWMRVPLAHNFLVTYSGILLNPTPNVATVGNFNLLLLMGSYYLGRIPRHHIILSAQCNWRCTMWRLRKLWEMVAHLKAQGVPLPAAYNVISAAIELGGFNLPQPLHNH